LNIADSDSEENPAAKDKARADLFHQMEFPMTTNWPQFAYQYVAGGAFFFITLYLCFLPGAADIDNPSDRKTLAVLLAGFAGYLAVHMGWILLASR
jgi:cytochrome bd-type quinol oxidase subunit 1